MRRHYEPQKPAGDIACDDTLATHGHIATLESIKDTCRTGWHLGPPEASRIVGIPQCAKILL
jgi:hypothetical protein